MNVIFFNELSVPKYDDNIDKSNDPLATGKEQFTDSKIRFYFIYIQPQFPTFSHINISFPQYERFAFRRKFSSRGKALRRYVTRAIEKKIT